jgi:hypothetical protein
MYDQQLKNCINCPTELTNSQTDNGDQSTAEESQAEDFQ